MHTLLEHVTGCPHTLWRRLTQGSSSERKRKKKQQQMMPLYVRLTQTYTHTHMHTPTLPHGIKAILPHLINSEDGLSRPWHGVHSALLRQHLS